MNTNLMIYFIAIPIIFHGLANLSGVFSPWTKEMQGFTESAWIFSNGVTLKSGIGQAYRLVWLASSLCLIAAGFGILLHQPWWRLLAILGCAFSLAAILSWWKAVPAGARFGAIFDLSTLLLLVTPLGDQFFQAIQ